MGGTIRCLMVAIIVIATTSQPASAQSSRRSWASQSDFSPMNAPALSVEKDRAERIRAWKPQGFGIPDSLKEEGDTATQALLERARAGGNAMMREQGVGGQGAGGQGAGAQGGGGMAVPGFTTGIDPNRATQRTNGPTTDPTTGRDRIWTPNSNTGPPMPSTDPMQADNRTAAALLQQQQLREQQLRANRTRNGVTDTPSGIDLPQQPSQRGQQPGFDASQYNAQADNRTQQTLAQQRLGAPSANTANAFPPLAQLKQQDVVNLGEWFKIEATDPRLLNPNFVQDLYDKFIAAAQAGKIDATNTFERTMTPPNAALGGNQPASNQPAPDPRFQNPQQPNPPASNQQPWNAFASSGSLGGSTNSNGFNLPQQTGYQNNGQGAAPDPRFASRTGPVASPTAQSPWGTGPQLNAAAQPAPIFNSANPSNQRSPYDPKLTREEIARLPPGGVAYDEYGLPLNRAGKVIDPDGYEVDAQKARKMTLDRMAALAKEKEDADRLEADALYDRIAKRAGLVNGTPTTVGYQNNQGAPSLPGFPNPSLNSGVNNSGTYAGTPPNGFTGQQPAQAPPTGSTAGQFSSLQKTFESDVERRRPEIDPADLAAGAGRAGLKKSNPYVNVFLLFSLVSNCFLFVWLHRLWQHHRDLIAQNRIATGGVSVE